MVASIGFFILLNDCIIFVVARYIQFCVNIVVPRQLHGLLCPMKKNTAKVNNATSSRMKCHEVDCNSLLLNNLPTYAANPNKQRDN